MPLSPNWWVDRSPSAIKKGAICAVKPIANLAGKKVDFELVRGKKSGEKGILVGRASSLSNAQNQSPSLPNSLGKDSNLLDKGNVGQDARPTTIGIYNPDDFSTMSRGIAKCPNCNNLIQSEYIYESARQDAIGHQLYAVAFKQGKSGLDFRTVEPQDLEGVQAAEIKIKELLSDSNYSGLIPLEEIPAGEKTEQNYIKTYAKTWAGMFNPRQLLTLVTYVEIINEAKEKIREELGEEKSQAIATYLALVFDRCADRNCRLARWHSSRTNVEACSSQHALNLMWNYPELESIRIWE